MEGWQRAPLLMTAMVVALSLCGCATIVNGRTQIVSVRSSPSGATVRVQSIGDEAAAPAVSVDQLVTPCKVVLRRKSSYVLGLDHDGYQPASAALESKASSSMWRNLVWIHPIGWLTGLIVDITTGAGYELRPDDVDVTLTPAFNGTASAAPLQTHRP